MMTKGKQIEQALSYIKAKASADFPLPKGADPADDPAGIYETAQTILEEITFLAELALERLKAEPIAEPDPIGYLVGQANVRDAMVGMLLKERAKLGGAAYNAIAKVLREIENMGLPSQNIASTGNSVPRHKCISCGENVPEEQLRGDAKDQHWSITNAEWCGPVVALETVTPGAAMIVAERYRQIHAEGWTASHDWNWTDHELIDAARCYLAEPNAPIAFAEDLPEQERIRFTYLWPFARKWYKPKNRIRNLVRAGALIAAEIDRLNTATVRKP